MSRSHLPPWDRPPPAAAGASPLGSPNAGSARLPPTPVRERHSCRVAQADCRPCSSTKSRLDRLSGPILTPSRKAIARVGRRARIWEGRLYSQHRATAIPIRQSGGSALRPTEERGRRQSDSCGTPPVDARSTQTQWIPVGFPLARVLGTTCRDSPACPLRLGAAACSRERGRLDLTRLLSLDTLPPRHQVAPPLPPLRARSPIFAVTQSRVLAAGGSRRAHHAAFRQRTVFRQGRRGRVGASRFCPRRLTVWQGLRRWQLALNPPPPKGRTLPPVPRRFRRPLAKGSHVLG